DRERALAGKLEVRVGRPHVVGVPLDAELGDLRIRVEEELDLLERLRRLVGFLERRLAGVELDLTRNADLVAGDLRLVLCRCGGGCRLRWRCGRGGGGGGRGGRRLRGGRRGRRRRRRRRRGWRGLCFATTGLERRLSRAPAERRHEGERSDEQ